MMKQKSTKSSYVIDLNSKSEYNKMRLLIKYIKKEGIFALFFDAAISILEIIYSLYIFLKNWTESLYPSVKGTLRSIQNSSCFF